MGVKNRTNYRIGFLKVRRMFDLYNVCRNPHKGNIMDELNQNYMNPVDTAESLNTFGQEEMPVETMENTEPTSNPAIESFVNKAKISRTDSADTIHTFSVSFRTSDRIKESDVMEGVLNACTSLNIEIEKFSWQKSADKDKK